MAEEIIQTPFEAIAPFYDELMKEVPYDMWVGYYLLLLISSGQQPRTMLEIGCGTGIITELLHKEGFEVVGVDISAKMIELAKAKSKRLQTKIKYVVADATDFQLNQKFDAAYSFFDSLNNILDPRDLLKCFQLVYEHLQPGGSFIFDLNTPYAFEHKMFDQKLLRKNASLRYQWEGDYDPTTKIVKVTMEFWKDGRPFVEIHTQKAYLWQEVVDMLEQCGFIKVKAYNSYSLDPPKKSSDRLHYLALKPESIAIDGSH